MKWISFKEQLPPSKTYILLSDGKHTMPYFTQDLGHFMPENKSYTDYIAFNDGSKLKYSSFTHWSFMPVPVKESCHHCEHTRYDMLDIVAPESTD